MSTSTTKTNSITLTPMKSIHTSSSLQPRSKSHFQSQLTTTARHDQFSFPTTISTKNVFVLHTLDNIDPKSSNVQSQQQPSEKRSYTMTDLDQFICLDAFAARQFTPGCESGSITYDKNAFVAEVKKLIKARIDEGQDLEKDILVEGYAPFCKHIFIENFTQMTSTSIKITPENQFLIKTAYVARTENELPVLSRFINIADFPAGTKIRPAKYLDLILYSREQIKLENAEMNQTNDDTAEWGIISIKAQDQAFETPMQPITMMRNALGKDQGGSGVPLDAEKYKASVAFWEKHVSLL